MFQSVLLLGFLASTTHALQSWHPLLQVSQDEDGTTRVERQHLYSVPVLIEIPPQGEGAGRPRMTANESSAGAASLIQLSNSLSEDSRLRCTCSFEKTTEDSDETVDLSMASRPSGDGAAATNYPHRSTSSSPAKLRSISEHGQHGKENGDGIMYQTYQTTTQQQMMPLTSPSSYIAQPPSSISHYSPATQPIFVQDIPRPVSPAYIQTPPPAPLYQQPVVPVQYGWSAVQQPQAPAVVQVPQYVPLPQQQQQQQYYVPQQQPPQVVYEQPRGPAVAPVGYMAMGGPAAVMQQPQAAAGGFVNMP